MRIRISITLLLLGLSPVLIAQQFNFGGQTTLKIGSSSSFYAGGNTTFNGQIINDGSIISFSDLDFVDNTEAGNLKFVGTGDQNLYGDTLEVVDLEVDKPGGDVVLQTEQVIVEGSLEVTMGVIQSEEDEDLIVTGSSEDQTDASGYVEGNLVGLSNDSELTFPMGINGFQNYLTLKASSPGRIIKVECKEADPDRLLPTDAMVGIADEVEWVITTTGDSIEVEVSAIFNGINLSDFPNGNVIRAQDYTPSLVKLGPNDTIYQDLEVRSLVDTDELTFGNIEGERSFYISQQPTYLSIALIPKLLRPEFYVPNAFSPNSLADENRIFRPFFAGGNVTSIQMNVWDARQNRLYTITETGDNIDLTQIGWDGKLQGGQSADDGVYYFSIKMVAAGENYEKVGSFLLTQ